MTSPSLLIKNAHIFDGHNAQLSGRSSVLLEGGLIREISDGGLEEADHLPSRILPQLNPLQSLLSPPSPQMGIRLTPFPP